MQKALFIKINPKIDVDDLGGAVITWQDKRNSTDYDIYAQRISVLGTAMWASNGVAVCYAANNQTAQYMKYLGSNGLVVVWKDDSGGKFDIYAQQLNLSGVAQLATI